MERTQIGAVKRAAILLLIWVLPLTLITSLAAMVQAKTLTTCPNCYQTIQSAIDAANPGDTVQVKGGVYEENLVINKDLILRAASEEEVKVKGSKEKHPVLLVGPSNITVVIEGMTLTGAEGYSCYVPEEGVCPYGIIIKGEPNVIIKECNISGNGEGGVGLAGSSRVTLTNSRISENSVGVMASDTSELTLIDCAIVENDYVGVALLGSARAEITGCSIAESRGGILVADCAEANISHNEIKDNGFGIASFSSHKTTGADNEVVGNGTALAGNLPGELRNPLTEASEQEIAFPDANHPTLQHAVDALLPGGTIVLAKGSYEAGITIDKKLTLRRMRGEAVTLLGKGKNEVEVVVISLINGADLHLEGLTISEGGTGITLGGTAKATITDCTISENGAGGIVLQGSSQAAIENNRIINNWEFGIVLVGKECGFNDWLRVCEFTGMITGSSNRFSGNEGGPVCPEELNFLMLESPGAYPEEE